MIEAIIRPPFYIIEFRLITVIDHDRNSLIFIVAKGNVMG